MMTRTRVPSTGRPMTITDDAQRGPPAPARPVGPAQAGPDPLARAHRAGRGAVVRPAGRVVVAREARPLPGDARRARDHGQEAPRDARPLRGRGDRRRRRRDDGPGHGRARLDPVAARLLHRGRVRLRPDRPDAPGRGARPLRLLPRPRDGPPRAGRDRLDGRGGLHRLQARAPGGAGAAPREDARRPLRAQARRPAHPRRRDRLQRHRQRAPHARSSPTRRSASTAGRRAPSRRSSPPPRRSRGSG